MLTTLNNHFTMLFVVGILMEVKMAAECDAHPVRKDRKAPE